jgi:GT2 family glycosyltransferase
MKLSVVLGSYNRINFLKATLNSIRTNSINYNYEIIVVDGGSTDGTINWLYKQKDVITILQHNRGEFLGKKIERRSWGYFMNLGFKCSQGEYILMISDDCLIVPNAINNGIKYFDELRQNGVNVGALAFFWRNWPEDNEYFIGKTMGHVFVNHGLYLNAALQEINYIDEDYQFYHADGDLCLRLIKNNYQVLEAPDSYVEHFIHANIEVRKSNLEAENIDWTNYVLKWGNNNPTTYGSNIKKHFFDESMTYKNFPKIEIYKLYIKNTIVLLKNFIKKILRLN